MIPGLSFADADSTYRESDWIILGVPFDRTSSFRPGSRFGPNAIREASYNFETFLFEHQVDLREVPYHDAGNLEEFGSVGDMVAIVQGEVESMLGDGKRPLLLGGEHSVTIPALRAMEDLTFVSIDAHLDFREEYLGERHSHACVTRRAVEQLGRERVLVVGVRSISPEESEGTPPYLDAFTLRKEGEGAIERALDDLPGERVYLSLDIDGIDPAYAPATGTPEPFGLDPYQVKLIIDLLGERLVGFDLTEVAPP
ncbi:MAG: agmatinase, partial [Methanomassiliicoccales archaeon]